MTSLHTTILMHPLQVVELRGFAYSQGDNLPFLPSRSVIASAVETNLSSSNQLPSSMRGFTVRTFDWRIPVESLAEYQENYVAYHVTKEDVIEFASKAWLALYCGGERPFAELVPVAKEITFDGKEYKQVIAAFAQYPLTIRRLEKIWTSVCWCHGVGPKFGGVVPLVLTLTGESTD